MKHTKLVRDDMGMKDRRAFFSIISDWKYMIKPETISVMLHSDVLTNCISYFTKLWMKDAIEQRLNHILFPTEGYFYEAIDFNYILHKFGITLVKEIEYTDIDFNRKIAKLFFDSICSLEKWWEENQSQKGYIEIPLLRMFSFWLSRYMFINLTLQTQDSEIKDESKYHDLMRAIFEDLFCDFSTYHIEHMLLVANKLTGRSIGFWDEIRSNKWVNLGTEIIALPTLVSKNLSHYYGNPDFVLVQLTFILTSNPNLMFKTFMEAYSIDWNLKKLFLKLSMDLDETDWKLGDDKSKEISNLKFFFYFINSLMVDDRKALLQWRPYKEFTNYEYSNDIEPVIEKAFHKMAKNEAIHTLVKMSGWNIKQILLGLNKQLSRSEIFEQELNAHAKCTTNRDGRQIFNIDPKFISQFNSYYYGTINEHNDAVKNYDEFIKIYEKKEENSKQEKLNPLNIENCPLGSFLSQIRSSIIKTDIPKIVICLLKKLDDYEINDSDIEQYSVHLLELFFTHASYLKSIDESNEWVKKIQDIVSSQKPFLISLVSKGAYKSLISAYNAFSDSKEEITQNLEEIEKKKEKKTLDRKKMVEKRKKMAMMKMGKQRAKIARKYNSENTDTSFDENSNVSEVGDEEVPKWQKWYESLYPGNFVERPYGYLASLVQTRLYVVTARNSFYKRKELDLNLAENEDQKEKIQQLEFLESEYDRNSLLDDLGSGWIMKSCNHMIHYDCLNEFKSQNMQNRARTLLIEDMGINEFTCPYCGQYSNTIVPPHKEMDILAEESIHVLNKESMISDDLINMMLDLINIYREREFVIKEQEKVMETWKMIDPIIGDKFPKTFLKKVFFDHEFKSLLKKDLMTPNQEIPKSAAKILNHSIQLIDVRGLFWMLSEKEKIRSVLIISKLMTTYSLSFDKNEIILPKPKLSETDFFKMNVSSSITQAIIYDYFHQAVNEKAYKMKNLVKFIKMGYVFILLQIAARVIYEQNGYYISNWKTKLSIPVLEDMVKHQNADLTIAGLSIETSKRFIDGSLSYLRKAAGLVSLFSKSV
jgi:hypothetical protein